MEETNVWIELIKYQIESQCKLKYSESHIQDKHQLKQIQTLQ